MRERRFYGAFFDEAPIGVALVSPDGRWIKVNRALCKLVGYSEVELLTRTFQDITYPEDLDADLECVRRIIAGEILTYQIEKRYIHGRGHLVTVLLDVSLVRDDNGRPLYFISQIQDITERKQTENALRESNSKFLQLVDNIGDAFWIRSADMRELQYISPAFERIWGRSVESLYANPQQWVEFTLPEDRERVLRAFAGLMHESPSLDIEYRIVRPGGEIRWVRARGFQVRDSSNKLIHLTGIVSDITERKRLEVQLLQSQKMETVGKLAGGIAHEFNNILTAIIGQCELLLVGLPVDSLLAGNATEISKAAARAATLTRQLLAFSGRTLLWPESLDLNQIISDMGGMFRHLMGGDVDVRIVPGEGLHTVRADAGQIVQVITSLAINARDAMPGGGKLTLETSNVSFDEGIAVRHPELEPANYAKLVITDTGPGMSADVQSRVFEPFFSTKGVGPGTGLGLSTCYGIIKQSGGHIFVSSELERGTAFEIYLPQAPPQMKISPLRLDLPDLLHGTETIVLVEKDPALREMAEILLGRLGYTVLAAADAMEALGLGQQRGIGHIDLMVTDVVTSERILTLDPHTRILFTSAYTEKGAGADYLQKPFTPSELAQKLREMLDR